MKNKKKEKKRTENEKIGVLKVLKHFQEGNFFSKVVD